MRPGYTTQLPLLLEQAGVPAEWVNIAVGANDCLRGLSMVKQRDDLAAFDIVLVEYAINDLNLYRESATLWMRAFEGLLRHLRRSAPEALVAVPFLGRSDTPFQRIKQAMLRDVRRLAKHYGVLLIDFDTYLRRHVMPRQPVTSAYQDAAHLSRPITTALLAAYAAICIRQRLPLGHRLRLSAYPWLVPLGLGLMGAWRRLAPQTLPAALAAGHFEGARSVSLIDVAPAHLPRVTLKNSRYCAETVRLAVGEAIELPIAGELLSVDFVSTADGCDLVIEDGSPRARVLHATHRQVISGKFQFLLKTETVIQPDTPLAATPRTLRLRAVPPVPADAPGYVRVRQVSMAPNLSGKAAAVHLVGLLVG